MTPRKPTPADVPRFVTDAREHLGDLRRATRQITDADLYLDGGSTETPDRTPKRVTSPALWEPARRGLHADWQAAWRHVSDAHRILRDNTDVPAVWSHAISDDGQDWQGTYCGRPPAHLATTVTRHEARHGVELALAALEHVDSPRLPPPEADAVMRACDEIRAARETLAGHLDHEPPSEDPPECSNEGCPNDAERRDDGRYKPECSACTKYRQRNGRPREVAA